MGPSRGCQFDEHLQCLGYRTALQLAPRLKQTRICGSTTAGVSADRTDDPRVSCGFAREAPSGDMTGAEQPNPRLSVATADVGRAWDSAPRDIMGH
jgi:hypothetical protein